MVPYGVPDPQKVYSIQLKKRTVAPLVGLTSEGILLSINTDGEEEPLPAVPKGNDAPKRLNPRDYMNQEILSAGSNAKIAEGWRSTQTYARPIDDAGNSPYTTLQGHCGHQYGGFHHRTHACGVYRPDGAVPFLGKTGRSRQ